MESLEVADERVGADALEDAEDPLGDIIDGGDDRDAERGSFDGNRVDD